MNPRRVDVAGLLEHDLAGDQLPAIAAAEVPELLELDLVGAELAGDGWK